MTSKNEAFIRELQRIVGRRYVLISHKAKEPYCRGYRSGKGEALVVVLPGSLIQQWQVLESAVAADKVIIMQAANTGLTEGSTPSGIYDREAIVLNTMRLNEIHVIRGGSQVISFAGGTLFDLEKRLLPYQRTAHSVIGSSCLGASIVGGVCNNSGGALVERGPAYTELALYAKINPDGRIELVNHLGVNLGKDPMIILKRLQSKDYSEEDITENNAKASDTDYSSRVREINAPTPARYNSDSRRLYEASGCAGKLAIFAVRLDTFKNYAHEAVFYVGTNAPKVFTKLRRDVLSQFNTLPVSGEYMHKDIYDLSKTYGKDSLILIDKLGTDRLPLFFSIKKWFDARIKKIPLAPKYFSDHVLQFIGKLFPNPLTKRMEKFRARFQHYLILKMQGDGIKELEGYLTKHAGNKTFDWFECTSREAEIAILHRFVAAGAAVRYQALHSSEIEDILPLDIALRRNDGDWFENLPGELEEAITHKLYYGHFFCHVLHQDYLIKKGCDIKKIKRKMLKILDARGAKYPAEHNVGHLYEASKELKAFYQECDPCNSFNPGIGKTSKKKNYV